MEAEVTLAKCFEAVVPWSRAQLCFDCRKADHEIRKSIVVIEYV